LRVEVKDKFMTFAQLEIFVTVVECQSFSLAASHLGISQSGVSHAVANLEAELGVMLIERHRLGIALTEMGKRMIKHAQQMLGLHDAILQEAAATKGLKRGSVRIGSFGLTTSVQLLPQLMWAFGQKYPEIELRVFEAVDREVIEWLYDRYVDVGFVMLPNEMVDTIPIVEDQLVAVLPADHPLAEKSGIRPAELAAEPFILSGGGSRPLIEEVFRSADIRLNVRYRLQQVLSILEIVRRGLGVSVVAELALPEDRKGLSIVPFEPRVVRRIGLAVRDRNNLSPASRAFFEFAQERYCFAP
jgi:DNA-binding transcriptional LysR family regulator